MPRIRFEKVGNAVWISHLDLMRVFQRAFRRGGILIRHSQGFTPRAHVSIALPLPVGTESVCELLDFDLAEGVSVPLCEIPDRLNATLPGRVVIPKEIRRTMRIREGDPSLISLAPWEQFCSGMLDLARRQGWEGT